MVTMFVLLTLENLPTYIEKGQELSDWTLMFYVSYVLVASFLIFNLFIGIVINSMEEARAIELHRAERELLDEDHANDERAHAVVLRERLHHLKDAVEDLERETRGPEPQPRRPLTLGVERLAAREHRDKRRDAPGPGLRPPRRLEPVQDGVAVLGVEPREELRRGRVGVERGA